MWRPKIKNHAFDRMGERFGPLIDPDHFMGQSAFDIKRNYDGPPVNIKKTGKLFELDVAVPGYKKDELQILLEGGYLIIRGQKEIQSEHKDEDYILEEFDFTSFERTFLLNEHIAKEKVNAHYEDGILHIEIEDVPEEEERAFQTVPIA
jgi:HSP20 family protein